jgi:hypothetical protein
LLYPYAARFLCRVLYGSLLQYRSHLLGCQWTLPKTNYRWSEPPPPSGSAFLFSISTAHHDCQQLWPIASPVAPPPPNRLAALHTNTMGDGPHVRFGRNQWRGRVIGGDLTKLLKTIFLHTTINWDMADCFACGAATPKPLGCASYQHHGRRPPRSVWSGSIAGASNCGGSDEVTYHDFCYT